MLKATGRSVSTRAGAFLAVVVGSGVMMAVSCDRSAAVGSGVKRSSIRGIQLGMTEQEVVSVLGQPLGVEQDEVQGLKTLRYTRARRLSWWYPMLWVHLKGGRVNEVYAKRYVWWGIDDEGAYNLTKDSRWEAENFEATFEE